MGDVVFDEKFCASERTIEETGRGNVSEVAEEAGAQDIYECEEVGVFAGDGYGLETLVD